MHRIIRNEEKILGVKQTDPINVLEVMLAVELQSVGQ